MLSFLKNEQTCRSRIIGHYFGNHEIKDCGICDNCLRKKKHLLEKEEFDRLRYQIIETVRQKPVNIKELGNSFNLVKKEKTLSVVAFLQSEKILRVDEQGNVILVSSK